MNPPNPRLQINREELAWAAGFFDGEGYTGLVLKGRGIQQQIPQVDPRPLHRFHRAVLGRGSIYSVPRGRWQDQWVWHAGSFENVQAVVAMLWGFLSEPKREQARAALVAYLAKPHLGEALCRRGHNDWVLTKTGKRYCDTCYKITRLDPKSPHRRSRPAIAGYRRSSGLCRQGHEDWHMTPSGQRYCRTCQVERRRAPEEVNI